MYNIFIEESKININRKRVIGQLSMIFNNHCSQIDRYKMSMYHQHTNELSPFPVFYPAEDLYPNIQRWVNRFTTFPRSGTYIFKPKLNKTAALIILGRIKKYGNEEEYKSINYHYYTANYKDYCMYIKELLFQS